MAEKVAQEVTVTEAKPFTAYGFAREANVVIKEAGVKELPPQMIYTYVKKGMIKTEQLNAEGAKAWAEEYLVRKVTRAEKAQAKIEAELKGESVDA